MSLRQPPVPLSRSLLWPLLQQSYEALGPRAWTPDRVPERVLGNPAFAARAAELLHGLLHELGPAGGRVTLIDLGVGSARFACYLLRALEGLAARSPLQIPPFRLVLADIAEANLTAAASHPALARYFEAGLLDLATFDATGAEEIHLRIAGISLTEAAGTQPLVAWAGYLFDALPVDAFRKVDGQLRPLLVGQVAELPATLSAPQALSRLELVEALGESNPQPYEEPTWNAVLDELDGVAEEGSCLTFPVGAMRLIARLREACPAGLVLLATDKGPATAAQVGQGRSLGLAGHGGIFSLGVNFHALARWAELEGGQAQLTTAQAPQLTTLLGIWGLGDLPLTRHHLVERLGPGEVLDLARLTHGLAGGWPLPQEALLALLRLSRHDPGTLASLAPLLCEAAEVPVTEILAAEAQAFEVEGDGLEPAWDAGVVLASGARWAEAAEAFRRHLARRPDHALGHLRLAGCLEALDALDAAADAVGRALALRPGWPPAVALMARLEASEAVEP